MERIMCGDALEQLKKLEPESVNACVASPPYYNLRNYGTPVWTVSTASFKGSHFAVFPEKLIEPCVLAGCPEGGIVLDPFAGSGTTGVVAKRLHRGFLGIEINAEYASMATDRIAAVYPHTYF